MQSTNKSQRGQVLIIFVFAAIALIAITGLAIDGGNVLSDRRHAQNAADTAAMAAALYKANHQKLGETDCADLAGMGCGGYVKLQALDLALANGYPGSAVEVHIPPIDGPYSQDTYAWKASNYVEVIINSDVPTFFARILGPGLGTLHNRVEAVALAKYTPAHALFGGSALVALAPTGCATYDMTGTGNVTLNNGASIFVNSDSTSCSPINIQHCGKLTINPLAPPQPAPTLSPPVGVVGNASLPTCTPPNQQTTSTHVSAVQFPPDPAAPTPAECSPASAAPPPSGGSPKQLHPGYYSGNFPPNKNADYFLNPGIYCVNGDWDSKGTLTGTNVLIWLLPNHNLTINATASFNLQGRDSSDLKYGGYLIYLDSTFRTWGSQACKINGNSDSKITGVIYAPNCDTSINGGANGTGLKAQVISYSFTKINGTADLSMDHNGTPPATAQETNWTGLMH